MPEADQRVFLVALRWADTPETKDALRTIASKKGTLAASARQLLDSKAPALDKITYATPQDLDMCWGAFFASGESAYVLTVIRCAVKPTEKDEIDLSQHAARWSLKSLCSTHKKVRDIKDTFYETAAPEERKILDELFKK